MIPYVPEPFIDRSVQYPGRRYITRPDSTVELCQISRSHEGQNAEGAIYAEGTPLNAESFNDEMTKVKDTFDSIDTDLQAKQPALTAGSGILIQNNVISATGGSGTAAYLAGLADVGLYAPASGEVLLFDGSQGKWINGDLVTGKKSGAVVAFGDGAGDLPVKDLNVEIKATQSGTGDPSPSNVRPISGWANVGVARAGKNLLDSNKTDLTYVTTTAQRYAVTFEGAGTYAVSAQTLSESRNVYAKVYSGGTYGTSYTVVSGTTVTTRTFTLNDGDVLIVYSEFSSASQYERAKEVLATVQVELGTATSYEPYTGTTVTIALGQTVFGGELDVTSGVLTITHAKITLDGTQSIRTTNWNPKTNTVGWLYNYSVTNNLLGTPRTSVPDLKCDSLTPTMYNSLSQSDVEGIGMYDTNYCGLVVRMADTSLTTESAINTYLASNPIDVVFPLAQPVTVQLTPTEIETLQGNNTIFADSGDILNLEYYRDEAKKIIDLFQFDESLKAWTAENFAPLYTDVEGTLLAGETYLILNSPKIFTTSTIDIYTDTFGVAPYAIEVQNGNVRLTFVARASDLNVKVRIT